MKAATQAYSPRKPSAAKVMKGMFAKSKDIVFLDPVVTIRGALDAGSEAQLEALAEELVK